MPHEIGEDHLVADEGPERPAGTGRTSARSPGEAPHRLHERLREEEHALEGDVLAEGDEVALVLPAGHLPATSRGGRRDCAASSSRSSSRRPAIRRRWPRQSPARAPTSAAGSRFLLVDERRRGFRPDAEVRPAGRGLPGQLCVGTVSLLAESGSHFTSCGTLPCKTATRSPPLGRPPEPGTPL